MSLAAVDAVISSDLPPSLRELALVLAHHVNREDRCWPSIERLMYCMKKQSPRTIQMGLAQLRALKVLVPVHGLKGGNAATFYEWRSENLPARIDWDDFRGLNPKQKRQHLAHIPQGCKVLRGSLQQSTQISTGAPPQPAAVPPAIPITTPPQFLTDTPAIGDETPAISDPNPRSGLRANSTSERSIELPEEKNPGGERVHERKTTALSHGSPPARNENENTNASNGDVFARLDEPKRGSDFLSFGEIARRGKSAIASLRSNADGGFKKVAGG